MEQRKLNSEALSCRQLSVAVLVAGLSPAAALAGRAHWTWLVLWTGVSLALGWLALRRVKGRLYQGKLGKGLAVLYCGWGVVLMARTLGRGTLRLETISGNNGQRLWIILLLAIPLIWMGWGKAAAFFRMVELLWLAMAVVLVLVLVFGGVHVEWRYVLPASAGWLPSAAAMGEILAPAVFVLPYLYKVGDPERRGGGLRWLAGLGGLSAALTLITAGVLGGAAARLPQAFFVAAGLLEDGARCEGLLSAAWLLPDLTLVGLLSRAWGEQHRPALACALAAGLAMTGLGDGISPEICAGATLVLLLLTLLFPGGKERIVAQN